MTKAPRDEPVTQIQTGKALRNAQPEWLQVLDPASGAYYYEHKTTGESVWEAPSSFVPAGASGASSSGVGSGEVLQDKLKSTLDRYRQFGQC